MEWYWLSVSLGMNILKRGGGMGIMVGGRVSVILVERVPKLFLLVTSRGSEFEEVRDSFRDFCLLVI